ncbi:zinc finger protein 254-like isoform X2 [Belonocnema kinseyi]|uniref:zinc finger protein 254-like isoform X2 n=1 Tax=Belonocnema kinseyi TaxID=2817044 RepID=UPI00143D1FDD|nr:zinc finger protein 254-like isoform X2 [Belonocnema kinseyi]
MEIYRIDTLNQSIIGNTNRTCSQYIKLKEWRKFKKRRWNLKGNTNVTNKSKCASMETKIKSTREYQPYILKQHRDAFKELPRHNEMVFTCEIQYSNNESLEIKEEIIEDYENTNYQSGVCTIHHAERNPKIQESNMKSEKKYKCEKCARSYKKKNGLNRHKKFECDVIPQFGCIFCGKRFKRKNQMNTHVRLVHLKSNAQQSKSRYNCDKCSRSYTWLNALNRHKNSEHGRIKPQFICDYCGYKTTQKFGLSIHVSKYHLH